MNTYGNPRILIIINNRNYGQYLEDCIKSIFKQDYPKNYKVVGIDAKSTDNSLDVYKKHKINVYTTDPGNQPRDLNRVIATRDCDYLTWINSDDMMLPNFISSHINIFKEEEEVGLVHSRCLKIHADGRPWGRPVWIRGNSRLLYKGRNIICHPSVMLSMHHFKEAGNYFDEELKFGFDFELWCRMGLTSKIRFIRNDTAVFRDHRQSMSKTNRGGLRANRRIIHSLYVGKVYYEDQVK